MVGLPLVKLGGLVLRTLTKPVAKALKSRAKTQVWLNGICEQLGQKQHQMSLTFQMSFRGHVSTGTIKIKDLPSDQAVENGADLLGELLIFSVAVVVASFEYDRSSKSAKEKERKINEREYTKQLDIEMRFRRLERELREIQEEVGDLHQQLDQALAVQKKQKDEFHELIKQMHRPTNSKWLSTLWA